MHTSVTLLVVSLLCLSVAEAEHQENQNKEGEATQVPDDVEAVEGHNPGDASLLGIIRELEVKLRDTDRQLEALKRELTGKNMS